jgi:hypothetical protein
VPTGTHHPDGIFIAAGPELQRGLRLEQLAILDVAPLMLHELGLAIPNALEGRFASEAMRPDALASRPPQRADATASVASAGEVVFDPEAEEEILARLRGLGYVE